MLDNLDICIVCVWKACRRLKQNSKDCQAFSFKHDVEFSCFWRSLLSLSSFCWASVDWVYKAMFWVKVSTRSPIINVYGVLLRLFHFVTGSYQSSLWADDCGRTRAMKATSISHENLMKTSERIKSGLMMFDVVCIQLISFGVLCSLVWAFLGN